MEGHKLAVERISTAVKYFYSKRAPFRIYHGSSNSTRAGSIDPREIVNTSCLTNILSISNETYTAIVESNVPMDAFVRATLRYGLIPKVVPEFPGITVSSNFGASFSYLGYLVSCICLVAKFRNIISIPIVP